MRSDGQAAIDAISAENANMRSQLSDAAKAPATAPPLPPQPAYGPGVGTGGAVQPPHGAPEAQGGQRSLMSVDADTRRAGKRLVAGQRPAPCPQARRHTSPPKSQPTAPITQATLQPH